MLKACNYELWSISLSDKPLDFTRFVISISLNWGLGASKASAKISMSPEAKKQLMNVKRGSLFVIYWGYNKNTFNKVSLYWIGTSWEINNGVQIELVHKTWELNRAPIRGIFTQINSKQLAIKAAQDKGIKVKIDKAKETNAATIAVNQTAQDEFIKQFKGQIIKHGFDGKSLEIISFENIKNKAQIYYISTEKGFINNMVITYKATVPKDKSYIELIGSSAQTKAEPNKNPSQLPGSNQANTPPLPEGTYALLLSTANKNTQANPILELKLVVNGQQIATYPCVSGRASTRNSKLTNNVIPDGEYTIDSKLIAGTSAEVGGKFLSITPKFKTARSSLGIHLDPSYNKKNGEDGTNGCIGLITAEDRTAVHKLILEKNIRQLIVNLSKKPEATVSQTKAITSAYYVGKLISNEVISSKEPNLVFNSIASLFKLFIALSILKSELSFDKVPAGQTLTIRALLKKMLGPSENPPANVLIEELGGVSFITNFCKSNGFTNTEILELYSDKITKKQSTVKDVFEVFKDIFMKTDAKYVEVQQMMSESLFAGSLNLSRQTHTKSGNNSEFEGAVSLVLGRSSTKYIVVVFAKTEKEKLKIAKEISPLLV
jgi:Beta-lactamase enzyme family/L,D-transpeptidase catalytic domain